MASQRPENPDPPGTILKILSYNVHSCIGTDRKLDPARIAQVIADLSPDIIGLQELDVGRSRTGGVDQAHIIASLLRMKYHFHAALHVTEERYGDAILTALPMKLIKSGMLPSSGEQRGALWVEITVGDTSLQVFNTHLGLRRSDRIQQAASLLSPAWLGHPAYDGTAKVLIGDLNSVGSSTAYKHFARRFHDAQKAAGATPKPTFPSRFPLMRLDHIFVSDHVEVVETQVPSTTLVRQASDHVPLLATVRL
ncbi:endonuclease/exonuclease/phosphatase family protein [Rhizobium halophilum]|uniref:endonuclease/exonuclease/phosphatase family protein n=1 Tax=Rhizobium halophilum TaxID=2846852 RepID=UPI001EFDE753|nr:endonuclease/exonuclease/phosphatase family protein [Rhizobium halophilum]MCF6367985.1 endonuclease/exonuclease/phosphatase family protein [Rhizobium halophilum]